MRQAIAVSRLDPIVCTFALFAALASMAAISWSERVENERKSAAMRKR